MAIVTAENLTKHYGAGTNLTKALDLSLIHISPQALPIISLPCAAT